MYLRNSRKSQSQKTSPLDEAKFWSDANEDPPHFSIENFAIKGRGIKVLKEFKKGDFLLHYAGEVIPAEEGEKREEKESSGYRFFFKASGKKLCVDATDESGRLGRLVNHGMKKELNCRMREVNGTLCLFSTRDIHKGEELLYDYGLTKYPWEKVKGETEEPPVGILPKRCNEEKVKNETEPVITTSARESPVVMLSKCCNEEKKKLQKMADALNIQICQEFCPQVTHLLIKTDPLDDRKCERTLKYFQAIAGKLWVLNTQWLEESEHRGTLLSEVDYEINADTLTDIIYDGPKKSRTTSSFLLADYSFMLSGFAGYEDISYDDIVALLMKCGGSVVGKFQSVSNKNIVLVPKALPLGYNASSKCTTVVLEWLFDTIATYSVQPFADYIVEKDLSDVDDVTDSTPVCSDSEIEDKDYNPDTDEPVDTDDECLISLSNDSNDDDIKTESGGEEMATNEHMDTTDECLTRRSSISSDEDLIAGSVGEENDDDCSTLYGEALNISSGIEIQQSKQQVKRDQKLQCCVFCEALMTKVSRHMERKHQNEKEVAQVLLLPKKSKERKQAWQALINRGNYSHNVSVLKKGKGTVIPKYRPRRGDDKGKEDYLPCSNCFAFFVSSDLWKHQKSCPVNNKISHYKGEAIYNGKLLIPKTCTTTQKLYEDIVLKMRDDEISTCVKTENLIIEFGERCYEKLGHHLQNHQYIAQRMRELARLLLTMKDISSVTTLSQCLEPGNWMTLLQGVKKVAGFNADKGKYDIPSLVLKLGHSLSKCGRILRNQGAMEQDTTKQHKAESFLNLYKDEWNDRLSAVALETLHAAKFNKPKLLPTVEDVHNLHKYLEKEAEALVKQKNASKYVDLAEICLVQIMLFNRKRSGEVERIQLEQYKALEISSEVDIEIAKALTKFERALIENHKRIEIRGKKGSKVPILFTSKMARNVNSLLGLRETIGIDSEYLFAKPGSRFPIRGTDALRKIANNCGSKMPSLLKSTNLRKQLATMSQLLNLNANDQDLLAKFMGHDLQIHREYYRIPQSTLEIAKVSKVLHAINEGKIAEVKDQTFDEMQLEHEELEVESSDGEDDDDDDDGNAHSIKRKDAGATGILDSSSDDMEDVRGQDRKRNRKRTVRVIKKNWTTEEQQAVQRTLGKYLRLKTLPGKLECLTAISKEPALKNRKWEHVKHYIRNRNISKKFK